MPATPAEPTASPAPAGRIRVAVVGGGIAGLVAARELALGGAQVTLLESRDRLGGRLRRETVAGIALDVGAEAFAVRGGGVAQLLDELGLAADIVRPAALGSWLVSADRAAPAPVSGHLGIPSHPFDRRTVRALGLVGALRAAVDPLLPRGVGADADTLAELVRARLGRRVLERLVAPVALGVHSAGPEQLPVGPDLARALAEHGSLLAAGRALRAIAAPAGAAVEGLRHGMGDLVEALERELRALGVDMRTGMPVTSVTQEEAEPAAWRVGADGTTEVFDAVLFASLDAYESTRAAASGTAATGTRTTVEVAVLVVRDARLDAAPRGTGALVSLPPTAESVARAKALTHVSAKWPHRFRDAPPGTHVLRLSYGELRGGSSALALADRAFFDHALADASRILGLELTPRQLDGALRARWESPAPVRGGDGADHQLPRGWALAGDWVSGTGLASVIPGARDAARSLLETNLRTAEAHTEASTE